MRTALTYLALALLLSSCASRLNNINLSVTPSDGSTGVMVIVVKDAQLRTATEQEASAAVPAQVLEAAVGLSGGSR